MALFAVGVWMILDIIRQVHKLLQLISGEIQRAHKMTHKYPPLGNALLFLNQFILPY